MEDVDRLVAAKPHRIKIHLPDSEGYAKIRVDAAYIAVVSRLKDLMPPERLAWMTMGTLPAEMVSFFGKIHADFMHTRAGTVVVLEHRKLPRKSGPIMCRASPELNRPILLPDGRLALCCYDFVQRHVIGDLLKDSWEEIQAGEPLTAIRRAMLTDDMDLLCRNCENAVSCV